MPVWRPVRRNGIAMISETLHVCAVASMDRSGQAVPYQGRYAIGEPAFFLAIPCSDNIRAPDGSFKRREFPPEPSRSQKKIVGGSRCPRRRSPARAKKKKKKKKMKDFLPFWGHDGERFMPPKRGKSWTPKMTPQVEEFE